MITATAAREQFLANNKPKIQELDASIYDRPPVYLFNVFDREHVQRMSYKTFVIPACAEGRECSEACVIPGMVHDYAQVVGDTLELRPAPIPGAKVADDVLGQGDNDLRRWGCFMSENETPSKREIVAARQRLIPTLNAKVQEADALYIGTSEQRNSINREHRRAAKYLRVERPWVNLSEAMERCAACGVAYTPGVAFCANGDILDEAKARKARPWLFTGLKAS